MKTVVKRKGLHQRGPSAGIKQQPPTYFLLIVVVGLGGGEKNGSRKDRGVEKKRRSHHNFLGAYPEEGKSRRGSVYSNQKGPEQQLTMGKKKRATRLRAKVRGKMHTGGRKEQMAEARSLKKVD